MKQHHHIKWFLVALSISLNKVSCESEKPQWSKPEQSLSAQNNDWIPVQGKCPTCRPNRDLDSQSTNEEIGKVLSPPRSPSQVPPQLPQQQLQFTNKQPRILPFGPNYPQFNGFIGNDNKPFQQQQQSTKLFAQEQQKPYFQYENSPFVKQPFSLPPQQLIPQSAFPQQQAVPQRFPLGEPYQFTLPLKGLDNTTPKAAYQAKIRFPDSEPPKLIPNNKITSQNTDEIQLLYVPVETLQRGRKTMKDLFTQNQYQAPVPHGFVPPQYNLQYSAIPKQPESQFYFPNFAPPPPPNYLQYNQAPPQRPESVYANISKNFLQPYFTINGLYNAVPQGPQLQSLPPKQPELQYYNVMQPGLYNNQIKSPEQVFKTPQLQPRPVQQQSGIYNIPNGISTFADVYSPTTPEVNKFINEYTTERTAYNPVANNQYQDFNLQYITGSPQTSASQNQQYATENKLPSLKQNFPATFPQNVLTSKSPQLKAQSPATPFEKQTNTNYPAPHQPPLSFYMEKLHNQELNDVLYLLKDAKTIPVLDTVEAETPQVFVGPSELPPPKGYQKYALPYLSSLDYNRIERMIDRLPFFVAPLNFKPPPGYSKIPFPAPHIGSVVLSNSSAFQQALHDKPFDQKVKPTTQSSFSASPELSTITPHLTSQINNLIDASSSIPSQFTSFKNSIPSSPPAPQIVTFRTYEDATKKPALKNTYRPSSTTTELPKRNFNRQRKPIYRGYPTSTESATTQEATTSTSTTTESQKFYTTPSKDTENYVEFTAKGKFNINNGNENQISSNAPAPESTYQVPVTSVSAPVDSKNNYDFSNFFTRFDPSLPVQKQRPVENVIETQKPTQNLDYSSGTSSNNVNNQDYFSNPPSPVDVKSEPSVNQVNHSEPESTSQANFNFNNVKPLSQYNPFPGQQETLNYTEIPTTQPTSTPNQHTNEFNFWNQNQFYKVNPNAVDYFSSTANYVETSSAAETVQSKTTTTTESNVVPEYQNYNQNREYSSSTEYEETTTPTTIRPRLKQRVHPHRYHQLKPTSTERETVDQSYRTSTERAITKLAESTYESSTPIDVISQSTENHEASTKSDIKPHRRRRPIRPQSTTVVTPVTEVSSSTNRSYRTRATRYPNGAAVTERYRPRRPQTTSSESTETLNSDWSSYNFSPSSAGSNEITNPVDSHPRINSQDDTNEAKKFSNNYWIDSVQGYQPSEVTTSTTETTFKASLPEDIVGTEGSPSWSSYKQSESDFSAYSPTAQNNQYVVDISVENKTEIVERKDDNYKSEVKSSFRRPVKTTYYEDVSSTVSTTEYKPSPSDEPETVNSDNVQDQEVEKKEFFKEASDGQKKAYDPQDEKKVPGRRRGTWVRRIRVKPRPHDVFETAESQNLGRITENSLQTSDSKVFSKTDEKEDVKPKSSTTITVSSSIPDEYVTTTEPITEKLEDKTLPITTPSSTTVTVSSPSSNPLDNNNSEDYANLQHNFAQMLSDFLNSNDQAAKPVNNLERNNVSTEKSISYILGLSNNENKDSIISNSSSSSSILYPTNSPTENAVTNADDVITITNIPLTNTEYVDHPTTTEQFADTYNPNKQVGTSTTTEISLETEICYRGKCVKTKKSKASDLLPVE